MYQDMKKYGVDKFRFQILAPVIPEYLTQVEQDFIEMLHPMYNDRRANGWNIKRLRDYQKEYNKKYCQSDKHKEANKKYEQSGKGKESQRNRNKKYGSQICYYMGEDLTLNALVLRFSRAGVEHPAFEAKKYLLP